MISTDYKSILLAIGETHDSQRAVDTCERFAHDFNAIVHIVYVVDSRIVRAGSLVVLMESDGKQNTVLTHLKWTV
jgi:nucleotide-binding universal stress UspA family protein